MMNLVAFALLSILSATPSDQFIFNSGAEPETLDPHRMTASNDRLLALQMFDGLVARDENYLKVQPAVASKWTVSPDGLKLVFTIRKDLKWSNGEPLTVEQVRGSLLRPMDPMVACDYIQYFTENIVGADDYVKNFSTPERKDFEAKVGIKIIGTEKIEFKLKHPNALFLEYLTMAPFGMVHPSMWSADSKAWSKPAEFITSGAYKLKAWDVNRQVVLEKNPYYRDAKLVKIPTVVALPINDENTTYNLYRSKKIDWTGNNNISTTLVSRLRADAEFSLTPGFGTYTYILNVKVKPLDDVRVRKALSLAIHRAEITDKILKGGQVPTNRFVPPGIEGYKPSIIPPQPFDRQIEMAKNLLAQAGFPEGKGFPKLTVVYNTAEAHHKVAQAVQQMWKKYLGINVGLENKEWKVFLQEQSQKKLEISRIAWIGDLPDAAEMMDLFLSSSASNHTHWESPEFDRIIRASASIKDKKKRNTSLIRAEQILLDEVPVIPIYHYVWFSLVSPRVSGLKPNMFGKYEFKYLTKK